MDGVQLPYVVLTRVSGGPAVTEGAELALTSGTAQDGVWSATIQVPSTWNGRWEPSRLVAVDEGSGASTSTPGTSRRRRPSTWRGPTCRR